MAKAAVTALWAAAALSALCGCGTIHNFCGDKAAPPRCEVFGGVRSDVKVGVEHLHFDGKKDHGDFPAELCADPSVQFCARAIGWYMLTVDLPLCVVCDTLTLPAAVVGQLVGPEAPAEASDSQHRRPSSQSAEPAGTSPKTP
jgi:uncharacterized protein YceK